MGPAQANRALDNPYLAVRVGYRRSSLLNALPMVPSPRSLSDVASAVLGVLPKKVGTRGHDVYWDHCV